MDLKDYFINLSRSTAVALRCESPAIKTLVSGKNKTKTGVLASFDFDSFKMNISYIEQGRAAYAQQTLWVSFVLESDETLPYSLYDILAFIEPQNFNCYTYTYVDSKELMSQCFAQLIILFNRIIPAISEFLKSGVNKNKLISTQRDNINRYFGDNILESGEMIGASADKLINMMLNNFYEGEIEAAVIGTQALFYNGKEDKALKKLKRAKARTYYQENLLKHIENGGKANSENKLVKDASIEKGAVRHGGGVKGSLKILAYTLLLSIPVSLGLALFYFLFCAVLFRESQFILGFWENIFFIPMFGSLLSVALSLKLISKKKDKKVPDEKEVHTPKSEITEKILKHYTIIAETLALIGCLTSVYSTTAFFEDSFRYSQEDFPLSQSVCNYESVEYFAIIEGYMVKDKFTEEKYVIARTISGATIDLYNSTYYSADEILKNKDFLKEKNIGIKQFKTIEEYEKATISD